MTLTARPWELTSETIAELRRQGLDEGQIESAVGVSAMFNYFTRMADATGIEFDYPTPLPAFEPDVCQVAAARPARPGAGEAGPDAGGRPLPTAPRLRTLWDAWHSFLLEADESLSTGQRGLVAAVAAEESGDWERAAELSRRARPASAGDPLPAFARKLSRAPWSMTGGDLDALRAAGHTEHAALHVVAIVAHQNADSRLAAGLRAARAAGRG